MISASRIAMAGLGGFTKPATGTPVSAPTACMACGVTIARGESAIKWRPSKSTFTDFQYLAAGSGVLCIYCAPLVENRVLVKTQKCVISEDGAWSLAKDAHRAWFLTDPPRTPFVAVISDSMKQHLIWRAPVTLDTDLLRVQIGRSSLSIDRPLLLEAVGWASAAAEIARAAGLRVTPNHPFARLDRERSAPGHGTVRGDILALANDHSELRELLRRLHALGEGELWGLSVLAKARRETPTVEPLNLS